MDFQADIDSISELAPVPTILDMVCRTTGMGFAAVARVTGERWVCLGVKDDIAFGLTPGDELPVETTICHEIRQSGVPVVINDVGEDPQFKDHKTPLLYGFQSYISMPIVKRDGTFFGTLCAIDPYPRKLDTPNVIDMFKLFADLIAQHLSAQERAKETETLLHDERETSELREQFIAVLGHDLRNPLAAIASGVRLLQRDPAKEKADRIAAMMHQSVLRMTGLIDNVLDFARGRLGGGIGVHRSDIEVTPLLRQVVSEIRAGHPECDIQEHYDVDARVNCDAGRLEQLFSNLLGNACTHGDSGSPVIVKAKTSPRQFELSVQNGGDQIPAFAIEKLFKPFARGDVMPGKQGLGLGLFIASEIAHAHGGVLEVASTREETRFTFLMPL